MLETPQEYAATLEGPGASWFQEFFDYMREKHAGIEPIMFRQRPMFRVGKSYVMFTVAKDHFSLHTLNFELIEELKSKLPRAGFGKGCANIKFADEAAKPVLKALVDEVVRLNTLENPPPVDVAPELPYEQRLANAFAGRKAKWIPLYQALLDSAKAHLPGFVEYFPAAGVLWKHPTTFAQLDSTTGALRVSLYLESPRAELGAIRIEQLSKRRALHTLELTGPEGIEALLNTLSESYALTSKP